MTINIYARQTKLYDVVGRSRYINSAEKQEEIVLRGSRLNRSWNEHAAYERDNQKSSSDNIQAREFVLALPNELYENQNVLKAVCDKFALAAAGENNDYEYAVHWNHARTNLHVHLIFSERSSVLELKPKIYKKDIWQDPITHKLTKKGEGVLVHKKGEVQLDENGNTKYDSDPFTVKDPKYKSKAFTHEMKLAAKEILDEYGYSFFEVYDNNSPYLHQEKKYKSLPPQKKQEIGRYNQEIKNYNQMIDGLIGSVPEQDLVQIKHNIFDSRRSNLKSYIKQIANEFKKVFEQVREITLSFIQRKENIKIEDNLVKIETYQNDKESLDIELNKNDCELYKTDDEDLIEIGIYNDAEIDVWNHSTWEKERVDVKGLQEYINYYPNFDLNNGEYDKGKSL